MVETTTKAKYEKLGQYIKSLNSIAVAFSGGVDSTFLLKAAHEFLDGKVIALTARSLSFPKRELDEAKEFTAKHGIEHIIVDSEELKIEGFSQNPANRCYLCKKELFTKFVMIAKERQIENVVEGANVDDEGDYRPGLLAIAELGLKSPLKEVGLTKAEIRELSKEMGLPTWDKQSFACLVSRIPYGDSITPEKLQMIDKAEQYLIDFGFCQVRVRCHGNLARIEIDEAGFNAIWDSQRRNEIYSKFKEFGFTYVSLDLKGYRVGSMNETLK